MEYVRDVDWSFAKSLSEKEQMRLWVETWKKAGPELERIKKEELRAMTEADVIQRTKMVMNGRARPAKESRGLREDFGLVEQQRIFCKARSLSP